MENTLNAITTESIESAIITEDGFYSFEKAKDLLPDFSEAELYNAITITNEILNVQASHNNLIQRNAYLLWAVESTKAYRIFGYKNTATYAKNVLGIMSKGSVSDAISTYQRFGETTGVIDAKNPDAGQLREKYRDFNFSTLMKMKKLTDDQIEAIGINPQMSRREVVEAIQTALDADYKAHKKELEDKKAKEAQADADTTPENSSTDEHTEETGTPDAAPESSPADEESEDAELSDNRYQTIALELNSNETKADRKKHVKDYMEAILAHVEKALEECTDDIVLETTIFVNTKLDE